MNDQDQEGNMVYEGHKDYKCKSCGKSFSQARTLKNHIQIIHEGHKDHKCESCGKSYFQAGDLKKNLNIIYEGHKDYECESCGKSYTDEKNLKKYIYTAHTNLTKTQSLLVEKYKYSRRTKKI